MSTQTGTVASEGQRALPDEFRIPDGLNKRCDLPPEAYILEPGKSHTRFARRPGFNTTGDPIKVFVNQFRVTNVTNVDVHQYDASLSPNPPHDVLYKKIWETDIVKQKLASFKHPWIHDRAKLAWSLNREEVKIKVDLGIAKGSPGNEKDMYLLQLRPSKIVRLEALRAYLTGSASWDTSVLESMNFLDHLLRQGPSERFKLIKRSLFNEKSDTKRLNSFTEAIRGIYAAIRMTESIKNGGLGLGINVDVSNQAFFVGQKMDQLLRNFVNSLNPTWANNQYADLKNILKPVKDQKGEWVPSNAFKALKRLHKLRFTTTHNKNDPREYTIASFEFDPSYGHEGAHCKNIKFTRRLDDGTEQKTTIFDYYLDKYSAKVMYWWLPVIKTGKGGYFPVEACEVKRITPYPFKLDPAQTSDMIRFAVQRPKDRRDQIMKGVANLNWEQDKYLKSFGLKINPQMPSVAARLIRNPEVEFFGGRKTNPRTTGRWDLRGLQFAKRPPKDLKSWAFVSVGNFVDSGTLKGFMAKFCQVYQGHGGRIMNAPLQLGYGMSKDLPDMVTTAYKDCGKKFGVPPQIIVFVLQDKNNTPIYERLKLSCDCRYAIPSQMLLIAHVKKASAQYMSNVCMKLNAKLGGQTSRIGGTPPGGLFVPPTCMIGVDVSHPGPGSDKASMASMCLSMDKDCAVYNGAVQTNGWRTEILDPKVINEMLSPMVKRWKAANNNVAPEQVFYFRDGVSEGQFAHVIEYELHEIRRVFKNMAGKVPKITVIVATKRHHIRFFPERGDKNSNPLPGTLVEREVTHPYHYDFYLCSHVAIQGTARPVHYNVIHDEIGMRADDLQRIIYHQCYTYCRSTTPVSLHPAVYYAHLASNRARCHEREIVAPPLKQTQGGPSKPKKSDRGPCPKLAPLAGSPDATKESQEEFKNTMWFV